MVLRGATQQILDESERSLHDALCVLQQTVKETRVVYGGGEWVGVVCYSSILCVYCQQVYIETKCYELC